MTTKDLRQEYEREYRRIGVSAGERLPTPRGMKSDAEYLAFLRSVPDGSGRQGMLDSLTRRISSSD